jgi:hypothetical protein
MSHTHSAFINIIPPFLKKEIKFCESNMIQIEMKANMFIVCLIFILILIYFNYSFFFATFSTLNDID